MALPTAKLPHSNAGRCTVCNCWLFYQRVDERIGVLKTLLLLPALLAEVRGLGDGLDTRRPSRSG
jgi:hypothetical protein